MEPQLLMERSFSEQQKALKSQKVMVAEVFQQENRHLQQFFFSLEEEEVQLKELEEFSLVQPLVLKQQQDQELLLLLLPLALVISTVEHFGVELISFYLRGHLLHL